MTELVICDTNAVIQIAIICPSILKISHPRLTVVVPTLVRSEIQVLKTDISKAATKGAVFDFILKEVKAPMFDQLPPAKSERAMNNAILFTEGRMNQNLKTAGSSPSDRKLLIMAKHRKSKLLTNDTTLHSLSIRYLGEKDAWKTGHCVAHLLNEQIETHPALQLGLAKLAQHDETLSSDCKALLKPLGFVV